jgi:hypothetical protein
MAYALLIHEDRARRRQRSEAEARDEYEQMMRFGNGLAERGLLKAADALKPDAQGVRVSTRAGRTTVLDGPFAEAREMIGGFFVFECTDHDKAIAKACPAVAWATVELREIRSCYDD